MLAELIVIVVILATVAFMYFKGSAIKSFLLFMNASISSAVAFAFFETAGRIIISYGFGGEWVFAGSFILIFVIIFVLLNILAGKLMSADIYFNDLHDRIGRSVIGALAGLVFAGVILVVIGLTPTNWPYERFAAGDKNINPAEPDKTLILNADGFVTGFASWLSRGSMSRQNSMATFHPDLLNEIYLNRIRKNENNSIIAGDQAIEVKTARLAPSELVFTPDNQPLNPGSGKKTVIIQAGISHRTVKEGGALARVETGVVTFTMAQVRLLCKASDSAKNLGGSSQVVYPVGILRNENSVDRKNLTDEMLLTRTDFAGGGTKWLDFVFYIPTDTTPVMLQFKMNAVAPVGKLQKIEEKPQTPASPTSPTTTP